MERKPDECQNESQIKEMTDVLTPIIIIIDKLNVDLQRLEVYPCTISIAENFDYNIYMKIVARAH